MDDDVFYQTLYDADGNPVRVLRQRPLDAAYDKDAGGGFGIWDSSHGHCALCGRLNCDGTCMGGS